MPVLIKDTSFTLLSPGISDTVAEDWGSSPDPQTGYTQVGSGIGGTLYSSGAGGVSTALQEGGQVRYVYQLICEICPLTEGMRVRDEITRLEYDVLEVNARPRALIPQVVAQVSRSIASS